MISHCGGRYSYRRAGFQTGLRFSQSKHPISLVSYYERRLPHWHPDGKDIFITWRLEGTLPKNRYVGCNDPKSLRLSVMPFSMQPQGCDISFCMRMSSCRIMSMGP